MYWKNVYELFSVNVLSGQKIPCPWRLYLFLKPHVISHYKPHVISHYKPHVISHYKREEHKDFILKILIRPSTEKLVPKKVFNNTYDF